MEPDTLPDKFDELQLHSMPERIPRKTSHLRRTNLSSRHGSVLVGSHGRHGNDGCWLANEETTLLSHIATSPTTPTQVSCCSSIVLLAPDSQVRRQLRTSRIASRWRGQFQ